MIITNRLTLIFLHSRIHRYIIGLHEYSDFGRYKSCRVDFGTMILRCDDTDRFKMEIPTHVQFVRKHALADQGINILMAYLVFCVFFSNEIPMVLYPVARGLAGISLYVVMVRSFYQIRQITVFIILIQMHVLSWRQLGQIIFQQFAFPL